MQTYIKINDMKETIERLQTLADRADKYNYPEDSNMGISISDIRAVLEFYEQNKHFLTDPIKWPEWAKFKTFDADGSVWLWAQRPEINNENECWDFGDFENGKVAWQAKKPFLDRFKQMIFEHPSK